MGDVDSLDKLCLLFDIAFINCTCSNEALFEATKELGFCFLNVSASAIEELYSRSNATLSYAVLALIISTIGLVGNSLVILVAFTRRRKISNCQKIIGCLAASDFVYALVQITISIPLLWKHKWLYGNGMCKVLHTAMSLGGILAIGFVVIITIERYIGIVRPLMKLTARHLFIMVCLNIAFCGVSLIPYSVYLKVNSHMICSVEWPHSYTPYMYESYMLIFTAMLPITLIVALYAKVIYALKSLVNDKELKESLTKKSHKKKVNETRKILKVVIALLTAFVVLVVPNRAIALYLYTNPTSGTIYNILSCVTLLTYPCHVTINPILYNVIDKKWRRNLNYLFRCKQNRKQFYGNGATSEFSSKGVHRSGTLAPTSCTRL